MCWLRQWLSAVLLAPALSCWSVPEREISQQAFHSEQALQVQVLSSVQQLVFAVYLPFGRQAVQPLVRTGDYAVRQAACCAAKLLTAFAVIVLHDVLMEPVLSLQV